MGDFAPKIALDRRGCEQISGVPRWQKIELGDRNRRRIAPAHDGYSGG